MIALTVCGILLSLHSTIGVLAAKPEGRVRVVTSPAPGLGRETGVGRRDPSDIVRIGERDFVFYTRLTADAPLYPAKYTGEIWYASSEDEGRTWREVGRLLGKGDQGSFDSIGVFEPNVLRGVGGELLLYYSGVGPEFNFRFEEVRRVEPVQIGIAKLIVAGSGNSIGAERLNGGQPILSPSDSESKRFDSLRVTGAAPLLRNGLYHLYYHAYDFSNPTGNGALGLATASRAQGPYRRRHEGRPVLPFGGDALVAHHAGGVMAMLTSGQRGLHWAADGEHFALTRTYVSGRLTQAGLWRSTNEHDERAPWGLHVAHPSPDPYLERFDLQVSEQLPLPYRTTLPVPSSAGNEAWTLPLGWLGQHRASLAELSERPLDLYFIGDGRTEGFGGHDRIARAPGAEVWNEVFGGKQGVNLGLAGDRTQHVLWRLAHGVLDRGRMRTVVLQVGGNNLGTDPSNEITAGIEAILNRVQQTMPQAEVVLVSLLPSVNGDPNEMRDVAACNASLTQLARRPRVRFLDLTPRLGDASGRLRPEFLEPGTPYLSRAGYQEWASALGPVLEEIEELIPEGAERRLKELGPSDLRLFRPKEDDD